LALTLNPVKRHRDHCRETREHVSDLLDGELDERTAARVGRHIRWCPNCGRMLAILSRTIGGLRGLRDLPTPTGRAGWVAVMAEGSERARTGHSAYRHILVVYDGTPEGDEALVAADLLAHRHQARLTVVVVVELERRVLLVTRLPRGTGVWNDVLLDRARDDLQRAARLVETAAEFTVLFGAARRAVLDGAKEFDCDAIMLAPRPRGRLRRLLSCDQAVAIRRRGSCVVLQPR
jgi:nucleotide-binding universal stress UspA family protein